MKFPEAYRWCNAPAPYCSKPGDRWGLFIINPLRAPLRRQMRVIAHDGEGLSGEEPKWEHVSVSLEMRRHIPAWEEMSFVKDLFWDDTECVVQFHPPRSQYMDYSKQVGVEVLHLWRPLDVIVPLPPTKYV